MSKIKTIYVCLFIPFVILMVLAIIKIKHKEEYQQKVVLAHEIRKVLDHLMVDLSQARENSIQNVPADGIWHDSIIVFQTRQGVLEYLNKEGQLLRISNGQSMLVADDIAGLRIRRQKQAPGILEVQIEAKKNVSLTSNLRIRVHQ